MLMVLLLALAQTGVHRTDPSFSPDGKRVVWTTYDARAKEKQFELWSIGVDAKNPTLFMSAAGARQPRFSPDGKKIVFIRTDAGKTNDDVWTINADESGLKRLTNTPDAAEFQPDFTADGAGVVFLRMERKEGEFQAAPLWLRFLDFRSGAEMPPQVDPVPKSLGITQVHGCDPKALYVLGPIDVDDKMQLKKAGDGLIRIAFGANGKWMTSLDVGIDRIHRFRKARSSNRFVLEVDRATKGFAVSRVLVVRSGAAQEDAVLSGKVIQGFDISSDGSKVIVSGHDAAELDENGEEKPVDRTDRLWMFDVATKTWSRFNEH